MIYSIDSQKVKQVMEGDIVLFNGRGFLGWLIRRATRSKTTHVGIAVKVNNVMCVFESTKLSPVPDLFTGKLQDGVRLTPLAPLVEKYDGEISINPLACSAEDRKFTSEIIRSCVVSYHGRPYEQNLGELVASALDITGLFTNKREAVQSLFCSELVAEVLQGMGGPTNTVSNEIVPSDLTHMMCIAKGLTYSGVLKRLKSEVEE